MYSFRKIWLLQLLNELVDHIKKQSGVENMCNVLLQKKIHCYYIGLIIWHQGTVISMVFITVLQYYYSN